MANATQARAGRRPGHGVRLLHRALLAAALALAAWPGLAGDDCDVPVRHWQSREAVRQAATARGWQVHRIKIDDGCYEVLGVDADGRAFKARLDPQTLEIVKLKHRRHEVQHDGHGHRGHHRHHDGARPAPPAPVPAAPRRDPSNH